MKHEWKPTKLWDCNALECSKCGLVILDYFITETYAFQGNLYMRPTTPEEVEFLKTEGISFPAVPKGAVLLRSQVSNVLNYSFKGRTRKEIITYAEDEPNRSCSGKKWAAWQPDTPEVNRTRKLRRRPTRPGNARPARKGCSGRPSKA
jgi:hypothetical protein